MNIALGPQYQPKPHNYDKRGIGLALGKLKANPKSHYVNAGAVVSNFYNGAYEI